jgi:hypothetical protein
MEQGSVHMLRGELEKVLDRITNDPAYRGELLANPRAALAAAGLKLPGAGPEVTGYVGRPVCARKTCGTQGTCSITCSYASPKTCPNTCVDTNTHTTR